MTLGTITAQKLGQKRKAAQLAAAFPNGARCQKCLEYGHWSYECKAKRKYLHRTSRTKQLNKKITEIAEKKRGGNENVKATKEKLSKKKKQKSDTSGSSSDDSSSSSSSDSDSDSDTSSSDSSSDDSSSDSENSSDSSISSDSDSSSSSGSENE